MNDSDILQVIERSPGIDGERFNPALLIQAVNALCDIGKQGAIDAMRKYLMLRTESDERQKLFLILRLLAVAGQQCKILGPLLLGQADVVPPGTGKEWPLFPLALSH